MKLFDIIKKVGGGVLANVVPGGGMLLGAVNAMLSPDQQLPANATGHDIEQATMHMSGADRASLMEKEFDVQITEIKEGNETLREMLKSDADNPQSTRPYIAKHAFHVIAFVCIGVVILWGYGVFVENETIVNAVTDSWTMVVALITPLITVLLAYFGHLVKEGKNKMDAANGSTTPNGIAGLLTSLIKK